MLCHSSIVDSFSDPVLKEYLRTKEFPYVNINNDVVLGYTGYMECMEHEHLPETICVGTYRNRHFLAIKVKRTIRKHYIPSVVVIFQRYVNGDLIVSNGLPYTVVNNSQIDETIIKELLSLEKPKLCLEHKIRLYYHTIPRLQPNYGFQDLTIKTV